MADTLAQMVRKKYPGVYDDISDTDLEAKVRAKYPGKYDDIPSSTAGPSRKVTVYAEGKPVGERPATEAEYQKQQAEREGAGPAFASMAATLAPLAFAPALTAPGIGGVTARAASSPVGIGATAAATTLATGGSGIDAARNGIEAALLGKVSGASKWLQELLGAKGGWTPAQQRAAMQIAAAHEKALAMDAELAAQTAKPVARGTSSYVAGQAIPEVAPVTNVVPFRGAPAAPRPVPAVLEGVPAGASMEDALRQSIAAGGKAIPRDNVATFTKLLNEDPAKAGQFIEARIVELRKLNGQSGAQIMDTLKDTYGFPMKFARDTVKRVLASYPELGTGAMK